jgi:hypothetical protein
VVRPGPWLFFTADEVAIVEAAVDRLIPPDNRGPGGKDAGCASPSAGRQALMSRRLMQKFACFCIRLRRQMIDGDFTPSPPGIWVL